MTITVLQYACYIGGSLLFLAGSLIGLLAFVNGGAK